MPASSIALVALLVLYLSLGFRDLWRETWSPLRLLLLLSLLVASAISAAGSDGVRERGSAAQASTLAR